ncbi:MAG TPA: helical backbone metal receptor [Myxococcota bacterium]|nr:helical backbone metal receptor [Myxococcota bacterium]
MILIALLGFAVPTRAHTEGPRWYGPPAKDKPARIVSLTPSTTEILFAIGAGSRVVAVTRYCDYPPEVAKLGKLGGVLDLNVEAVLAAKPDLVVAIRSNSVEQAFERLGQLGLSVLVVPSDTLVDLAPAVSAIAEATGDTQRGRDVIEGFDKALAEVKQRAAKEKPLRTLILVADRPLVAAGKGSFIDGAVATIGLANVITQGPFPEVGREEMLKKNPELLLDLTETGVPAVGQARLVRLKDPRLLRLTPRLPQALADLARTIRLP